MVDDFTVTGTDELVRLGRNLKEADAQLKKDLLRGIRETNKPVISHIRESARDTLPKAGGLADVIARSKIGTRTRLSGKNAGIEIKGTGVHNLRAINAGKLRHPLFGNRGSWSRQSVKPGFFDEPIEKDLVLIQRGIEQVMADTARKIEKGI